MDAENYYGKLFTKGNWANDLPKERKLGLGDL
jgi:hypothetical protein